MFLYMLTSWKVVLQSWVFFALWCYITKQNKAPRDDSIWTKGGSFSWSSGRLPLQQNPMVSSSSMGMILSENVWFFSSFCFLNGKSWMLWLACLIFTAGLAWLWAMWSSATVLILAPALSEDLCVLGYLDSFRYFLLLESLCSSGKTAVTQNHTIFQDLPILLQKEKEKEERRRRKRRRRREGGEGGEAKTYNCQMEAS